MTTEGWFATSDGVTISYAVHGTGPPLFICHGGPFLTYELAREDFAPLEESFALVFHDYRGSGRSGTAPPDTYDFDHLAKDLDELRQLLGNTKVDVLAHSMGVWIALHYALGFPGSVNRLVLAGGSPVSPNAMRLSMTRALGPVRVVKVTAQSIGYGLRWGWRPTLPRAQQALMRMSQTTQVGWRGNRTRSAERPWVENDNGRYLLQQNLAVNLENRLPQILSPTLVLYGEHDAMAVAGASRFRSLPHAEFRVVPGAGHDVHVEAPDATCSAVSEFLQGAER